MTIKSFKRYEKKYLLSKFQYELLVPILYKYMEEDSHCKNGNEYEIYNIYYDTDSDEIIEHSLSKPYFKEKLRLRSYKVPVDYNEKVFLELKKKINGIVNKRRIELTIDEANNFIENGVKPKEEDYISNQIIEEINYFIKGKRLKAKSFIGYKRVALFAKDNKDFRITFDYDIKSRRSDLELQAGGDGENLMKNGEVLMEVKILGAIPLWLTNTFSELEIYSRSFSKYGREYKSYSKNIEVGSGAIC